MGTSIVRTLLIFAILLSLLACSMPEVPGTVIVLGVSLYDTTKLEGDYIGTITDIPGSGIYNLRYCDNDAADVAALFRSQNYIVKEFVNATATRANLEAELTLADPSKPVIVYYSGHGQVFASPTVTGIPAGYYMLPYGFADQAGSDLTLRRSGMLTIGDIQEKAYALGLKHCIVITDCCYSGGFVNNSAGASAIPEDYDPVTKFGLYTYAQIADSASRRFFSLSGNSKLTVITASGALEESFETAVYENGVFTEFFLKSATKVDNPGIPNPDRDKDGYVTTSELYLFVANQMNANWNGTMQSQSNTEQIYLPHISDSFREYIIFKTQ